MSRLRKAAKATAAVQIFNWLGLLLSLCTVPLYLQWLGQERYGLLLTTVAFASYLMFSNAGVNWASMLLIAQANGNNDRARIASIMRNSFPLAICSVAIVTLVVGTICFCGGRVASRGWMTDHPEFTGLLVAIGISVGNSLCIAPFYNLLNGLQETHLAAVYHGFGRISGTLIAIGIAWSGAPLGWVYGGHVAGASVAGLFAALHCVRRHRWAFCRGPLWESAQICQQLRTGTKSLMMTAGTVLWGTAPILAISYGAGAEYVPVYSIPLTLLNAPLSILSSFSSSLQPGYGEAMGRGETKWIAETIGRLLRQVTVSLGLLGSGFLLLARPFVQLWTGGKVTPSLLMLTSVLAIAATGTLVTVLRYALTGINRHRLASIADFLCGGLAMLLSVFVVRQFGYQWIGYSMVFATLISTAWIFPVQLYENLGISGFLPSARFLFCLAITTTSSSLVGWGTLVLTNQMPEFASITASATAIIITFCLVGYFLLCDEMHLFRRLLPGKMRRTCFSTDTAIEVPSKL